MGKAREDLSIAAQNLQAGRCRACMRNPSAANAWRQRAGTFREHPQDTWLKQSRSQGQTPQVILWLPYAYHAHVPMFTHTHTPNPQVFFSFETHSDIAECGVLNEMCPTSLRHLNIWFPVFDTVSGGLGVVAWGREYVTGVGLWDVKTSSYSWFSLSLLHACRNSCAVPALPAASPPQHIPLKL